MKLFCFCSDVKSGGERSFSTLCFALALHEMTEAPFRAMDEFDVFMVSFATWLLFLLIRKYPPFFLNLEKLQFWFLVTALFRFSLYYSLEHILMFN